ncbi:MAG: amidohydrolase [Treponema sp.]|nr:amidohydrolase [Treponema sp.]
MSTAKKYLSDRIEAIRNELTDISDKIHDFNEIGFKEFKSSKLQQDYLASKGFKIEANIAGMETAFTAEYGSGSPVLAFLGEFDALEGLGHGCGHHLLGTGALAPCIALKDYFEEEKSKGNKISGTIRFYACPAEEGGSGKMFLAKDGYFKDVDAALSWHPGNRNGVAKTGNLGCYQVLYNFKGRSSHAAAQPENGRSALDAVELMDIGVNYLREHIPQEARIHYAITETGGRAPNVVQSKAQVYYFIRSPHQKITKDLYARVTKCAEGAAHMTETELNIQFLSVCTEYVPNKVLVDLIEPKLFEYYDDVQTQVEPSAGKGSTDVGDVSWVVPTAYFSTATWTPGTVGHSQDIVDQGKSQLAYDGMINAAKIIADAALDLIEKPELLEQAKKEFKETLNGEVYDPGVPADFKPVIPN